MSYISWFIPLCTGVSIFFAIAITFLTVATLRFRKHVNQKYNRGRG